MREVWDGTLGVHAAVHVRRSLVPVVPTLCALRNFLRICDVFMLADHLLGFHVIEKQIIEYSRNFGWHTVYLHYKLKQIAALQSREEWTQDLNRTEQTLRKGENCGKNKEKQSRLYIQDNSISILKTASPLKDVNSTQPLGTYSKLFTNLYPFVYLATWDIIF